MNFQNPHLLGSSAAVGLSVAEYLNQVGAAMRSVGGFVFTSELRADIQEGLDEADRGELISIEESRADLQRFKAEWRAQISLRCPSP